MGSFTTLNQRVSTALNKEIDRIHLVNSLYWRRGKAVTAEEEPSTDAARIG
jgi:hypothetical protein